MEKTFPSNDLLQAIFSTEPSKFEELALQIFQFQFENNIIYRSYCDSLKIAKNDIQKITDLPFLPIQLFKTHEIKTGNFNPEIIFESSGTTGQTTSKHYVKDLSLYKESFMRGFEFFYNDISSFCVIGLLPSYLERQHSSLVYMTHTLIEKSGHQNSGFYLYEYDQLYKTLLENESNNQPTLLIGVTYALLEFAEKYPQKLHHTIIMETGGMKGRRNEINRRDLHQILSKQFGTSNIHSEYGMTELLSQAYSKRSGIYQCPNWMKVLIRPEDDPLSCINPTNLNNDHKNGAINIIDLANIYSCSFIATEDRGKFYSNGDFEVLGRIEHSDTRGCGLMIAE